MKPLILPVPLITCWSGEPKGKGEKGETLGLPDPSLCLPDPSLSLLLSSSDITTPAASGFTAHSFTDGSCTLFTAPSFHRPSWPSSMVRPDLKQDITYYFHLWRLDRHDVVDATGNRKNGSD